METSSIVAQVGGRQGKRQVINALTVDVEDWYQTSDFSFPVSSWNQFEDRVATNTRRLLDMFAELNIQGTFFVLGCVAQRHPDLVREIAAAGHEVGSHGGWHQMLTRMEPTTIEADIAWSKSLLEDLTGHRVTSFRAPSWSLSRQNLSVLKMLERLGFLVDSSLQPFRTPLSGMAGAPRVPFHPVVDGERLRILEFPSTVSSVMGLAVPFSGGLYLRTFPIGIIRNLLNRVNRTRPGMIYIHPWELDVGQPRVARSPLVKFSHYYRLSSTEKKLRGLLEEFRFGRLSDLAATGRFPHVNLS